MSNSRGSRWYRAMAGLIGALIIVSMMAATALAQDSTITSTKQGETPTSGGARPGPATAVAATPAPLKGALPVSINIADAQIDAAVEEREIVNGVMQDPSGPWVVSWYKETPRLGADGNTVMSCHLDYWDVGPAVCYNIGSLQKGQLITVNGDDGKIYTYKVDWVRQYDAENAPIQEIVGPTSKRALTLITCGGPFDYQNGVYLQRTVVRANYVGSERAPQ